LKRAGLDYWQYVDITYYDSIDEFFAKTNGGEYFFITKFGEKTYSTFNYADVNKDYYFVFGRETKGLPPEIIENNKERCLRIPMNGNVRSLNLSNTAAILTYEALRQQNFLDLN